MIFSSSARGTAALRLALLASLAGSPAMAQVMAAADQTTNASAGESTTQDGEIVVVGSRPIAESLAAALAVQKNSDSLVSVLAADAIGRLPDQNIAQAVSRLPGISVQRDQGQARYINIRGAPLQWTTLSFDGIYVISPEGRDARFDSLPSAIAGQVIVNKAVTADLNGETIAGNVNIVTRSAFDYKGMHVQAKAGAGFNDLGNGAEYEASAVLSNRWETGIGDIGVLVSGSYYQRTMGTDNFEIDWETVGQDVRPVTGADPNTLFDDGTGPRRVWAREIENKFYRLTRKNWSVTGRLDWQPDADNKLFAYSVYSIFLDDELRDNFRVDGDDRQGNVPSAACVGSAPQLPAPGTTGYADVCTGNTPLRGTVYGVDYDARYRRNQPRQSILTNTIGGDHTLSDDITLRWRGNYTRSKDDRTTPYVITYQSPGFGSGGSGAVNRVTVDYDLTNPQGSQVALFRTLRASNGQLSKGAAAASYLDLPNSLTNINSVQAVDITNAYTAKAELFWKTRLFGDTLLRFGAQYDDRTKTANESQIDLSGATGTPLANALTAAGLTNTASSILSSEAYRQTLRPGYSFNLMDDALATRVLTAAQGIAAYTPVQEEFYRVKESVWSGYAMATTRFDGGNIVYGARIEHVRNSGTAFVFINNDPPLLTTVNTSSTLVFPSAHLNWNVSDEHKLRLGFTTGAARPDYTVARPSFNIDDGDEAISGGNPFAVPERARGVDLYWEYYGRNGGFASVGVFYKDVSRALFEASRQFGDTRFDTAGLPRSQYDYSTTVNGGDGYIWGAEAALQLQVDNFGGDHGFIGGFGIIANATYNKSRVTTPDGRRITFPGTSRWVYNVGPYFEKYGVSARVVYQKRTEWLSELGDGSTGGDIFWDTDGELDASIRYAITPNIEVYAEGGNLLNGPGRRYAGNKVRTLEFEKFGRRFQAGVRVTY
ncbi:TonB-dependent receptor [Sandarakinorhabdus sp.]|uniref:TonB-dependent receptor n=1 Tax=Sandarakinorhabdus sp. TaxID=1916663 RepID=UPI0028A8AF5F|nr:TonB-dependent receptor [Sandarakinorhabdus sp.]